MAFRLIQEGERKANKRVGSYLSVIQTCVIASNTRCRHSFAIVFLITYGIVGKCLVAAHAIWRCTIRNTKNLPRKIQSSGQYAYQGLTLLEALCSSSWSRSSNAAMSAFWKRIYENKIDRRRHIFWLGRISRYSLQKHDANNNGNYNKTLLSCPFLETFRRSQMIDLWLFCYEASEPTLVAVVAVV